MIASRRVAMLCCVCMLAVIVDSASHAADDAAALPADQDLKPHCSGLMLRDCNGKPPMPFIDSVVVQVKWSELEPADQQFNGPGWQKIERIRQLGLKIRLRIFAGVHAPQFVKRIGGPGIGAPEHGIDCPDGGIAIWNQWDQRGGSIPRFWLPDVLDQYEALMTEVARRYEDAPNVCEVVDSACMTLYAEPFYRAHRDAETNARLRQAGLTFEKDLAAHRRAILIHDRLFKRTRTSLAVNSWDILDETSPTGHGASFSPTFEFVTWARSLMGQRLVLQNNGTGPEAGWPSTATPSTNHFCFLNSVAGPKGFQTRTLKRLGGTEQGLCDTIGKALEMGAEFVELPSGFQRFEAEKLRSYDQRLQQKPQATLPAMPESAELAFSEDWSSGAIDRSKWYALRKKWGDGNYGVVPENIRIARDVVDGREQNVLTCEAHGDLYDGALVGWRGERTRVGGVLVAKPLLASGRYEVVMKIDKPGGIASSHEPLEMPIGCVPAIWTYAYRYVSAPRGVGDHFAVEVPLYNPLMPAYGGGANEYWSEIDFPELGKQGDFSHGLYNTFCQNRHDWRTFAVPPVDDHEYHVYTMDWRTTLKRLPGVRDSQVVEHDGYWWVQDMAIPFEAYLANPLKRLGKDDYAVYWGQKAEHWLDGVKVGENLENVPVMAAQLNLGVWLPKWGGPAPWKEAEVSFARVRIWQYSDPGDVLGILDDRIPDNIDVAGKERR